MKKLFLALVILTGITGCSTFTQPASPQSIPVKFGAATTNETQAVAWIELAQAANRLNPTPSAAPIAVALTAAGTLATAAAGWFARHKSNTTTKAAVKT